MRARLLRYPLDSRATPSDVARVVARDAYPFTLAGNWAGGGAVAGSEPVAIASPDDDPFDVLARVPEVDDAISGAIGGGWFGYLGYQAGARVEHLPPSPARPIPMPEFHLAYYDHVLRYDANDGRWWFEALATPAREDAIRARYETLRARLHDAPRAGEYRCGPFAITPSRAAHVEAVECCRARIADGEIYQANICLRMDAKFDGDPAELFARGVMRTRPPYAAFVAGPWGAVASLSPELFLRRAGRDVRTSPIKGTARRDEDGDDGERRRDALRASAKDRAENVMIVDLMRNDLGRVCRPGSVRAPELVRAEAHPGVWHLVSDVVGMLRDDVDDAKLVRACFPPGSVTGAPKIRAMEIISELEEAAREVYTGAIGYASPCAGLELNVAIRTFEIARGRIWLGAGGGIVADSDPEAEFEECLAKARPLLDAIGARMTDADPSRGVFDTLLAIDGTAVDLDEHLARLGESARAIYAARLPADLRARVVEAVAAVSGRARVRVVAVPHGASLEIDIQTQPAPIDDAPATLRPLVVPGGLGSHKWCDRDRIPSKGDEIALLIDADGSVLEAARANIFIVEGRRLVTPPLDGRLLPGVTRASVLQIARELGFDAVEEPLTLARMSAADEVFLSGSVRGIQPVVRCEHSVSCENSATWDPGPVAAEIARELDRRRSGARAKGTQ